ncbi:MAG: hypothetical protein ACJA1B_002567, partial [Polaribacter sp.]
MSNEFRFYFLYILIENTAVTHAMLLYSVLFKENIFQIYKQLLESPIGIK